MKAGVRLLRPAARRRLFSTVTAADLDSFRRMLSDKDVVTEASTVQSHAVDWLGRFGSGTECPAVLFPRTVEAVSAVLEYCNQKEIAVVPQAGNTGMVGGSVPVGTEIVLSVQRLNRIAYVDPLARVVEAGAGVTLQALDEELQKHDLCAPLDLAAKGSCCIGGNVSTNAGGIRFLRFGSLHQNVLGLRVVLASGEILDLRSSLPKDNTGYDLKQLFIGAEGSLGVVTDVVLQAPVRGKATNVALLGVASFDDLLKLVSSARLHLGEIISALECADRLSATMSLRHTGRQDPLGADGAEFYLLVETQGSNEEHDGEKLDSFLSHALENGLAGNGVVAQSLREQAELWALRENITSSFRSERKHTLKYDVSLPVSHYYQMVEVTRARMAEHFGDDGCDVVGFGHIGDGNLHLNVLTDLEPGPVVSALEPWVYQWIQQHGGSISAEHGIGVQKRGVLQYSKPPAAIELMRSIKRVFDPKGILNPYKVLPEAA